MGSRAPWTWSDPGSVPAGSTGLTALGAPYCSDKTTALPCGGGEKTLGSPSASSRGPSVQKCAEITQAGQRRLRSQLEGSCSHLVILPRRAVVLQDFARQSILLLNELQGRFPVRILQIEVGLRDHPPRSWLMSRLYLQCTREEGKAKKAESTLRFF